MTGRPDDLRRLAAGTVLASFRKPDPPPWLLGLLGDGLAGVVLFAGNVADPAAVPALTRRLHDAGEQTILALDEEGGDVTRLETTTGSSWPGNAALGAVDDTGLTHRVAAAMGAQLRDAGIDLDLAPCIDINSEPTNPVIGVRSFGADADLVARHTTAFVEGMQSAGVAACAKHFPGHGDTTIDSHLGLPTVTADRSTLERRELVPFAAAVRAGVATVMTAHLTVPAVDDRPATVSPRVLTDLLRDDLGFRGAVITDALDMGAVADRFGVARAAVKALGAGADLLCLGPAVDPDGVEAVIDSIVAAVRSGELSDARLADANARRRSVLSVLTPDNPAQGPIERPELGLEAAGRAIRVLRPFDIPVRGAHVIELDPVPGIAAGRVPWGLADPLRRLDPTATAARFDSGAVGVDVERATGRPLVLVGRDMHRHPWQVRLLTETVAARPDTVVVEMGWPSAGVDGLLPHVVTHGASAVSGEALARVLLGQNGGPDHG